jgi:hypothetical protein
MDNRFILRAPENRWLGVLLIQRLFDDQKISLSAHMLACISTRLFHYVLLLNPHHKKAQKCYINKVDHNGLHSIYSLRLCLCLSKHHTMETYGELEVWLHAFVVSTKMEMRGELHATAALFSENEARDPIR